MNPLIKLYESDSQIGREFRQFQSGKREFSEYYSLGLALASLNYRAAGSSEDWQAFYETFSSDPINCYDALDVALAGTSATDIRSFGSLLGRVPTEPWVIRRLFSFFPTLVQCHPARDVENLLGEFLRQLDDTDVEKDLVELATQYGLTIHSEASVLVAIPPGRQIPPELLFAHGLIVNEEQRGVQRAQLSAALERKSITVISSGYSEIPLIRSFQTEVLELIEELNGRPHVVAMDSATFTQLPAEISGRRKVVFAFPTYLTAAKQDMGYSVCGFGTHRRLGVLYPPENRLGRGAQRPDTLNSLLTEVRRNNGQVWCLQNYAISEIVRQEAEKEPDLETYFNGAHLILKPPVEYRGSTLPLPRMQQRHNHNMVFVYDLAGHRQIQEKIRVQKKNRASRDSWLLGATADILTHSLSIPVGVGFTKYLVKWLIENENWPRISELVGKWSERSDFQKALHALGVDPLTAPPQPAAHADRTAAPRLRAV